jgi:mRNA interferase RelE/StbE
MDRKSAEMVYQIEFRPRALKDLRALSSTNQKRVLDAVKKLGEGLAGDVKHLTDTTPEYRLRVGDYRVLFEVEKRLEEEKSAAFVVIYRVLPRDEAYR